MSSIEYTTDISKVMNMKCIICNKELEAFGMVSMYGSPINDGIWCCSNGNFGSKILDMDGLIVFLICDDCLKRKAEQIAISFNNFKTYTSFKDSDKGFLLLNEEK